jgi:hypothetical protein
MLIQSNYLEKVNPLLILLRLFVACYTWVGTGKYCTLLPGWSLRRCVMPCIEGWPNAVILLRLEYFFCDDSGLLTLLEGIQFPN